jgi:phosphoglycolate phosphatase
MFKLSELLQYNDITIQCHDNPDPDALSSAFGVYTYLVRNGKNANIIYSGVEKIKKRNIRYMIEWLNIPVRHVRDIGAIPKPELLVCVDCQYGEGNITRIEAEAVAIIDHHRQVVKDGEFALGIIQSSLGSCATLVWDLLRRENFDFGADKDIPASLYYGLLTDTNNFTEISHPLDKDMRDALVTYCDRGIVNRLKNCNLTVEELEIAGVALLRNLINTQKRYALFKSEFCDPNILGLISDIALQVDDIDTCIVYNIRESGARLSVRSCSREVMASECIEFLTKGVGSGGGHRDKAGGAVQQTEIEKMGLTIVEYMQKKTAEYFDSYDIIDAANHNIDVQSMKRYLQKPLVKCYTLSADIFEENTPLVIRTFESDLSIKASKDLYLMVGVKGDVYPVKAERFASHFKNCDPVEIKYEYEPTVKNELSGEIKKLLPYLKYCVSQGDSPIYAQPLPRHTKVFTEFTPNGYLYGKPGDCLAVRCHDIHDVYIIRQDVFAETYEETI